MQLQAGSFLLVVMALAGGATPSMAAVPTSDLGTSDTRALMDDYARCVVAKHSAKAAEAILRNVDNATFLRTYPTLIDGDCLVRKYRTVSKMSFKGDLYYYALADALVQREFASSPPPDLTEVPRLSQRPLPEPPREIGANGKRTGRSRFAEAVKAYDEARAFDFLAGYGECVVRVGPADAKALLMTVPASPEEARRFEALRPALGQCLPENTRLEFGKVQLRGSIALSYFRLAHAASPLPPR